MRPLAACRMTAIVLLGLIPRGGWAGVPAVASPGPALGAVVESDRSALPPLRIQGQATALPAGRDLLTGLDRYTAGDLWDLGSRAFDACEYDRALALYERLVQLFPEWDEDGGARFNAGLAAEKARLPSRAAEHYLAYLAGWPAASDVAAVRVSAGRMLLAAGRPAEAKPLLVAALAGGLREEADRFESRALLAQADMDTGRLDAAEQALSDLAGRYRTHRDSTLYSPYHGAMVRYLLGEVHRLRAEAVTFDDVDDRALAEAQLERKARSVLDAQREYLETIRFGVREWVAPAGYRLGELYRRFRVDVIDSPSPRGVTGEDEAVYRDVLREQTTVLLIKARECYRKVLDRAAKVNIRGEWVDRMRASLREIDGQLIAERVRTDI